MAYERRDKGSGSIRKRNDNLWEGRYKGKVCYGKNKTEAGRNLKELVKQIDEVASLQLKPTDYTFGEWIDKWLSDYKQMSVKETTYSAYAQNIKVHIKPALGDIKLSTLSSDDIQMLLRKMLRKGSKPATVVKVKNIINGALEQAVKNRHIVFNPVKATTAPKIEMMEVRVFTREEQTLFVDTIKGHRLEALFLTALGTGMRRGELIALTWDNVDFDAKEISVCGSVSRQKGINDKKSTLKLTTTKSKRRRRIIPINNEMISILQPTYRGKRRKKTGWKCMEQR